MDKINIVSSQAVLEMSSFSMDTRSMSSSPLVNSLIKTRLFNTRQYIDEPPFQFIQTMDLSVVDTMLHDSPDLVIHRTEIWAVWRPQVGRKKVWRFLTQQFNCCTCAAQSAGALSCWNTKSLPDTLRIDAASRRHNNVILLSAIRRDITRISCFVTTMKLKHNMKHCRFIQQFFVNKCMRLHFFSNKL